MADSSCCEPEGAFTNNPLQPCSGTATYPACYTVPPALDVLPGFKVLTFNPDCTVASVQILDALSVPVPGAVEAACLPVSDCECDPLTVCGALQALAVQVPAPADTAVYAGPGGCFLGVPIAGAVAFPLLAPNGTCAAPSYSFTASPDSGMFYDPAGVGSVVIGDDSCLDSITVGASIRIQTASVTRLIFTNTGEWDVGGSVGAAGEVLTSNGPATPPTWLPYSASIACPYEAPCDGDCVAPAYSFASDPSSGMFYQPANGNGGVVIGYQNCQARVDVGQSIILENLTGQVFVNADSFRLDAGGSTALEIPANGEWQVGGSPGAAGEVLTSAGAGAPPVWTAQTVGSGGMVWAAANIGSAAETRIIPVGYDDALISTVSPKGYSTPRAGTFRNMYVRTNTANGNGATVTYTLRVNGVATLLSVTRATGAVGTSTDLVNSVVVAAGDLIEMMAIKPASIGSGVQEVFVSAEFGA
jgi:hypothetical protein